MKLCSHCKKNKLLSDFGPDKKNKNGLSSWCKECHAARAKLKRQERKGVGLCVTSGCSNSAVVGHIYCDTCLRIQNTYTKCHRRAANEHTRKYYRKQMLENREEFLKKRQLWKNNLLKSIPNYYTWWQRLNYLKGHNYSREGLTKIFEKQSGIDYLSGRQIDGTPDVSPKNPKASSSIILEHNNITHLFRGWARQDSNKNFGKYDADPEQAIIEAMRFYEADMNSRDLPAQWKLVRVEDAKAGEW